MGVVGWEMEGGGRDGKKRAMEGRANRRREQGEEWKTRKKERCGVRHATEFCSKRGYMLLYVIYTCNYVVLMYSSISFGMMTAVKSEHPLAIVQSPAKSLTTSLT